jgi:hypothetical protein
MKTYFLFFFIITVSSSIAQKPEAKTYLLDSLRDECFYKIEIISETLASKDSYYFTIGRAQAGFFVSGYTKQINISLLDTARKKYQRQKLEKNQLDSLKQFELKLISLSSFDSKNQKQVILISNQAYNYKYVVDDKIEWNGLDELLKILFRV